MKSERKYRKEFWYRWDDTKQTYSPNTRKFWATISWVMFIAWFVICVAIVLGSAIRGDIKDVNWGFLGTTLAAFMGNAQMAVGWYTMDKNSHRKHNGNNGNGQ